MCEHLFMMSHNWWLDTKLKVVIGGAQFREIRVTTPVNNIFYDFSQELKKLKLLITI